MHIRVVATVVLLVVAAACGGDDGPDRDAYVDAAVSGFDDASALDLAPDDVECLAGAIIDGIGVDRLDDAGVAPEDLADAESLDDLEVELAEGTTEEVAEGIRACEIDFSGPLTEQVTQQLGGIQLSEASTNCISERLLDSGAADALAAVLLDGEDAEVAGRVAAAAAFASCPEAVTELFVAGLEGQGLAVTEDARACIAGEIEGRSEDIADAFGEGYELSTAQALAVDVIAPCQGLLAG